MPIYVADVIAGLLAILVGASGTRTTAAPSPGVDATEFPYEFTAITIA